MQWKQNIIISLLVLGFHRANFNATFTPCIEIGWRIKYEEWENGYATEGAKVCLKYGVDTLSPNAVRGPMKPTVNSFSVPQDNAAASIDEG